MHSEWTTQSGREYHFFPVSVLHYLQQTSWQVFSVQTHTPPPQKLLHNNSNSCVKQIPLRDRSDLNRLFSEPNHSGAACGEPEEGADSPRVSRRQTLLLSATKNNQERNSCCQQTCPCVGPWGVNAVFEGPTEMNGACVSAGHILGRRGRFISEGAFASSMQTQTKNRRRTHRNISVDASKLSE